MTSPPDGAGPRIGLDVTAAVTQGGGIGRYCRELVGALARRDSTFQYRLFSAKPPANPPVKDPIPQGRHLQFRPLPLSDRWLYRLWYRLRLPLPVQLATGRIDLFHSPDFVLPPVWGDLPTLLTVHDLSFLHFPEVYPASLVRYLNRIVPWSVRRATHILADSVATKADLEGAWRVPADRVTVLYSGVGDAFQAPVTAARQAQVRDKYDLGPSPFLLAVGTLQPRKNYGMLIRAFRTVADQWPGRLYIAGGRGWLYDDMMAEVAKQNLTEKVRFLGFVADEDLPALYRLATLFLFPSLYEGFGLPALEAMACEVPVLLANVSSLPEVGGNAAQLIPPEDERAWSDMVLRLLGDEDARKEMVQRGLLWVKRFTWDRAAAELEAVYDRLLMQAG